MEARFKKWCNSNMDDILKNAVLKIKDMKHTRYRGRPVEEIWSVGELFTRACVQYHETGDFEPVSRGLQEMARHRIHDGFEPQEVLAAMMMLKVSAMEKAKQDFPDDAEELYKIMMSIEKIWTVVLPELAQRLHEEAMKKELKEAMKLRAH